MLWVKTFHILFVMAWMAGLFYLPRILVHYVEGKAAGEDVRRLTMMAEKLFRFSSVMCGLALALGVWLWLSWWSGAGHWITAKIGLVCLLLAYHWQCYRYLRQMQSDRVINTSIFFRIFNESALLIVVPILALVVHKPF
jgi:protoporphyrinogen IX oxidase